MLRTVAALNSKDRACPDDVRFWPSGLPDPASGLEPIGVLILIDENMVETRTYFPRQTRLCDHLRPVQQQVIVVEYVLRLLRAPKSVTGSSLGLPSGAHGILHIWLSNSDGNLQD